MPLIRAFVEGATIQKRFLTDQSSRWQDDDDPPWSNPLVEFRTKPRTCVSLKAWCATEAQREGITPRAVEARIKSGAYPHITVQHVNKRVVYVSEEER